MAAENCHGYRTFLIILEGLTTAQCTTKQLSARHWDSRPLLMPLCPRTGRVKSVPHQGAGTRGGGSLLLDKIMQVRVLN